MTLVAFNAGAAFELDGHTSAVAWLVDRCRMGRSTAKEKLRVAHELHRRPVINDAFLDGTLSYSQARALTRLVGLNDERDAAFVAEFAQESADSLERLVRYWNPATATTTVGRPIPTTFPGSVSNPASVARMVASSSKAPTTTWPGR